MNEPKPCPGCGGCLPVDAPEGLCPACLLEQGLPSDGADAAPLAATQWNPPSPEQLAILFPDLENLQLLGRGGMGAVYKARQTSLDRLVAVKILPPEIGRDPAFAERFSREAKALARLNHPHIVTIYDFGRRGAFFFFLMEFVDGANLRQRMDAGQVAAHDALAIVPQICDALQYAHEQGIVHRDIKPDNILLTRQGRVKIADFGLAKLLLGAEEGDLALAAAMLATGRAVGTAQYMAPEQLANPREVDHRADIYSLGVVFYQLLTGELPPEKFVPPSRKNAASDAQLDPVVERTLARDPARRYQQMSQVKTAVENINGAVVRPNYIMPRAGTIAGIVALAGLTLVAWHYWPARPLPGPAAPPAFPPPGLSAPAPPAAVSPQAVALAESVKKVLPPGWQVLRVEPNPKPVYRPRGQGVGLVVGQITSNVAGNLRADACNIGVMTPDYDEKQPVPKEELLSQMANRLAERPAQLVYAGPEGKILVWPRIPDAWPTFQDDLLQAIRKTAEVVPGPE